VIWCTDLGTPGPRQLHGRSGVPVSIYNGTVHAEAQGLTLGKLLACVDSRLDVSNDLYLEKLKAALLNPLLSAAGCRAAARRCYQANCQGVEGLAGEA